MDKTKRGRGRLPKMDATTVLLKKSTKRRLESLRSKPRESMDSVIARLANMAVDNEPLSREEIDGIRRSLKDIGAGRVRKMKDVATSEEDDADSRLLKRMHRGYKMGKVLGTTREDNGSILAKNKRLLKKGITTKKWKFNRDELHER